MYGAIVGAITILIVRVDHLGLECKHMKVLNKFDFFAFKRNSNISQWKTHVRSCCFAEVFWNSNLWKGNRLQDYNWESKVFLK